VLQPLRNFIAWAQSEHCYIYRTHSNASKASYILVVVLPEDSTSPEAAEEAEEAEEPEAAAAAAAADEDAAAAAAAAEDAAGWTTTGCDRVTTCCFLGWTATFFCAAHTHSVENCPAVEWVFQHCLIVSEQAAELRWFRWLSIAAVIRQHQKLQWAQQNAWQ